MKALVIDDEPDNVWLLTLQLARHRPQIDIVGTLPIVPKGSCYPDTTARTGISR